MTRYDTLFREMQLALAGIVLRYNRDNAPECREDRPSGSGVRVFITDQTACRLAHLANEADRTAREGIHEPR